MATEEIQYSPAAKAFLARLPEDLAKDLSEEHKIALCEAAEQAWRKHPVDMRLNVPFMGKRYYLTMVGGKDNRCPTRHAQDKGHYPLRTVGNILFFLGIGSVFYLAAFFIMAMQSSIIEF